MKSLKPFRCPCLVLVYLWGGLLVAQEVRPRSLSPLTNEINRRLPRRVRVTGEERTRTEFIAGDGFRSVDDLYLLNRVRLNLDIQPLSWLKFTLQGEDSRVFGQSNLPAPASQKDAFDFRLGYVKAGSEKGPVTLWVGRQGLEFGEGRLLADPGWSNVGKSFDAARLTLRRGRSQVDFFTGTLVKVDAMDFDRATPGQHFHGAYGSLRGLGANVLAEPYLFWRLEHNCRSEGGKAGNLDEKTMGVRWAAKLSRGVDYGFEVAGQTGTVAGDPIRGWTGRWVTGYTWSESRHAPRVFGEYARASGDSNPKDGRRETFDPLFPSAHDKYGLTDLFGSINMVYFRAGGQYKVRRGLAVAAAYNDLRLANTRDGLYIAGKVFARGSSNGNAGTHVGQEGDVQALWTVSNETVVNTGYGRLFPGEFLRNTSGGIPYNLFFLSIAQRF